LRNWPTAAGRESHGAIDIAQAQRRDFAELRRRATIAFLKSDRPDGQKPAMPMATQECSAAPTNGRILRRWGGRQSDGAWDEGGQRANDPDVGRRKVVT
jgi:hypothetical protein